LKFFEPNDRVVVVDGRRALLPGCRRLKCRTRSGAVRHTARSAGFTLIELMIVVAIGLILCGLALPSMSRTLAVYRSRSSAVGLASLMQQARLYAVANDTYVRVRYVTTSGRDFGYADVDNDGTLDANESSYMLASGASFTTAPAATLTGTQVGGTIDPNTAGAATNGFVAFSARGVPCTPSAGTGAGACPISPSAGSTTAYAYYIAASAFGSATAYSAVTVDPAGRVKVWRYDGQNWR
jgi:type IV fimbrial biogenesis protein FimT